MTLQTLDAQVEGGMGFRLPLHWRLTRDVARYEIAAECQTCGTNVALNPKVPPREWFLWCPCEDPGAQERAWRTFFGEYAALWA